MQRGIISVFVRLLASRRSVTRFSSATLSTTSTPCLTRENNGSIWPSARYAASTLVRLDQMGPQNRLRCLSGFEHNNEKSGSHRGFNFGVLMRLLAKLNRHLHEKQHSALTGPDHHWSRAMPFWLKTITDTNTTLTIRWKRKGYHGNAEPA